ncbi:MAG: hypothetical protein HYS09_07415, partial [Chloroflexi bacterium]|nr:hypothetical protein [Chloroflexota bacterium]
EQVARLTFIVPLYIGYHGSTVRRVEELAFLQPEGADGFRVRSLCRWDRNADSFSLFESPEDSDAFARWAGLAPAGLEPALASREAFLARLLEDGTASIPAVNQAIEGFYRGGATASGEG